MTLIPHFLKDDQIYLREVRPDDVDETYHRWMNDPAVTRYLESRFFPNAIESLRAYVAGKAGDHNNAFFAICLKDGDRHIGNIKLGPIDWLHRLGDIGILIGEQDCWGKGYATAAIRLISGYAFQTLNLHKVTASVYANNTGSLKAFLKAGFEQEGIRRSHAFFEGSYVDVIALGQVNPLQNG